MADQATVKVTDVTNPADAAAKPAGTTAPDAPEVKDTTAADLGKLILDSGYSPEQVNELLNAPKALEALRYAVQNDPEEFIRSLERANPGAGENFLDKLSKLYVDRYDRGGKGSSDAKDGKDNELFDTVTKLREEVTTLRTTAERNAAAASQAQIQARFEARVEDLFGQIDKGKFPISPYETELIKGKLQSELAKDPQIVQRVMTGNFADVPVQFSRILKGMADDRKSRADAEIKAREASSKASFPTFEGGPIELPKEFTSVPESNNADDIWNIDPLVKVLESTGR